ncbi:C-type lectin domain family 4 member M-like [Argopecten irradians]|uniref:C-type lectin domain family 4 member M-like n=1 Tax=Argopecten irradians TaxID=31199 RepID=UPI0037212FB5
MPTVLFMMTMYLVFAVLILIFHQKGINADNNGSSEEKDSFTIVDLLNVTYIHIDHKIHHLQGDIDLLEQTTCKCNDTELSTAKEEIIIELNGFSKPIFGLENEIRLVQKEQAELRDLITAATTTTTVTSTTAAPRACETFWITTPEKCLYFSWDSERSEWAEAVERCRSKGANLVEVKTDEEARILVDNFGSGIRDYDLLYTGRRRNEEGVWVFLSNDEPVDMSLRSWASTEPTGGSLETCGCAKKADGFLMNDCLCDGYDLHFICEILR